MARKPIPAPGLIIGIDPSQRHNGIAVFDAKTGAIVTDEFGFVEDIGTCELLNRTAWLAKQDGCRVFALIECPTWSGQGTKEVRSAALVWERAIHRLFPIRTVKRVDPRAWQKQLLGGAKGDTKGLAIKYARLGLKIQGIESDHQADAACICEYARLMAAGLVSP